LAASYFLLRDWPAIAPSRRFFLYLLYVLYLSNLKKRVFMTNEERKAALEAIIYAADEPATIDQLSKVLGEEKLVVQASLDELVAGYAAEERGIEIRCVAGGYKLYTKPQQHDVVRRFIKSLRPPLRLTMPALETLAVIAYKQPVTAPEISEIRGVNTSGVISTLLDKRLISTAGRKEVIGRPILYKTSKEFLMRFGLSDLEELPSLKEFEALAREALGTDEGVAQPEVASDEWRVADENQETPELNAAETVAKSGAEQETAPPADADPIAEVGSAQAEPDMITTGQELVVEDASQPGAPGSAGQANEPTEETVEVDLSQRSPRVSDSALAEGGTRLASVPAANGDSLSTPSDAMDRVERELAAAEEWREHEALATAEGMPAGELDEDPPAPSVKSTAAGE
jgi:segregation and condensation protein B